MNCRLCMSFSFLLDRIAEDLNFRGSLRRGEDEFAVGNVGSQVPVHEEDEPWSPALPLRRDGQLPRQWLSLVGDPELHINLGLADHNVVVNLISDQVGAQILDLLRIGQQIGRDVRDEKVQKRGIDAKLIDGVV